MPIVGKWAENNRINYTTYTDLASRPEVYELIETEARKVNRDLTRINDQSVIKKFVLLYKELDADTTIKYQDGRTARIKTTLVIKQLPLVEA
jgi:long-chain acyl-CoA synthetase